MQFPIIRSRSDRLRRRVENAGIQEVLPTLQSAWQNPDSEGSNAGISHGHRHEPGLGALMPGWASHQCVVSDAGTCAIRELLQANSN